jgi:hypothetical protein
MLPNRVGDWHDPDRAGHWDYRPASALTTLANTLDVGGPLGAERLESIPSVWARVLGFAIALTDQAHPLYDRSVEAFRGFLTLLALRERQRLIVQVHPLNLARGVAQRSRFLHVAQALIPAAVMDPGTRWDRLFVFYLADHLGSQTIGMTSPLTLVCPNEGAHLTLLGHLPWFRGGRFVNPIPCLPDRARQDVGWWIQQVRDQLVAAGAAAWHGEWSARLLAELESFRTDLQEGLPPANPPAVSASQLPLGYGVYVHLRDTLVGPAPASDLVLQCLHQPKPYPLKDLYIYDPHLPANLNISEEEAANLFFLEHFSYASVRTIAAGGDRTHLGHIALPANAEWRRPEEFFTDRLVLIGEKNAFPGALPIRGQDTVAVNSTALLPIKEELLSYLTPDYIQRNAQFQIDGAGIRVLLKLPLPHNRHLNISRTYADNEIVRTLHLPLLEVWPDFHSPQWRPYFTFWHRGTSANPFSARPFIPSGNKESFAEASCEITELDSAPGSFVCFQTEIGPAGPEMKQVGVLLTSYRESLPVLPPGAGQTFEIGVDFGTTNTRADLRSSGGLPQPLELQVSPLGITAAIFGTRLGPLLRNFLPPSFAQHGQPAAYEGVPFLSFYRTRTDAAGAIIDPLREGHILFYNHQVFTGDEQDPLASRNVHSYLKWEEGHQPMAMAYLKQLCLHCAAEAFRQGGRTLHWYYSLPTAFSLGRRADFIALWAAVRDWIESETGMTCNQPSWLTESVAAARYFTHHGALPGVAAVVIDIGGGTSDIAIWAENKLILQTSVRLAGPEMFLKPLFENRCELLPLLLAGVVRDPSFVDRLKAIQPGHYRQFYAHIDALLREDSSQVRLRVLPNLAQLAPLIAPMGLGLCGLFYYVGLMLRHLRERGSYGDDTPQVFVGGNGSTLFHWVARGAWTPAAAVNGLFREVFLEAAGLSDPHKHFTINLSDKPKAEASIGLIIDIASTLGQYDDVNAAAFTSVVAGEPFEINRQAMAEHAAFTSQQLSAGVHAEQAPSLRRLLGLYKENTEGQNAILPPIPNGDDQTLLNMAESSIRNWVVTCRSKSQNNIALEPLFIVGLRKVLEDIGRLRPQQQN